MNTALELPFIGLVPENVMYAAGAAIIITFLIALVWRSLGKGALVGILALIAIVIFAMVGR